MAKIIIKDGEISSSAVITIPGKLSIDDNTVINNNSSGTALLITQTGTGEAIRVEDSSPDSTPFVINSSGKVGIGVASPSKSLHINNSGLYIGGTSAVESSTLAARLIVDTGNGTGHTLADYRNNNGSTLFVGGTNVGIGTNTPTSRLQVVGNTVISGSLTVTGSVTELSTRKIKTNIESLTNELNTITRLNPVVYNRIDDGRREYGFIAEEVKEIYPEFVIGEGINYPKMVSILVGAVKELVFQKEEQNREIQNLKNSIAAILANK